MYKFEKDFEVVSQSYDRRMAIFCGRFQTESN